MKPYDTLIKLSKEDLDKKKRELNSLLEKKDLLLLNKDHLGKELIKEQLFVAEHPENSYVYPLYEKGVKEKQTQIDKFIEQIDKQANILSEQISIAFSELKKYEIIMDKKEKEILAELARRERIMLDEMGLNSFQRKQKANK